MLTKTADGDYLTVNQWAADGNQAEDTLKRLKSFSEAFAVSSIQYEEYPVLTKAEELDVENWLEAIKTATNDMKANQYDKVVLAREVVLSYDGPILAESVVRKLLTDQTTSYVFAIEQGNKCFVGASPERLIKKSGKDVMSTCLAGSIKRGENQQEDDRLGKELLHDEKISRNMILWFR